MDGGTDQSVLALGVLIGDIATGQPPTLFVGGNNSVNLRGAFRYPTRIPRNSVSVVTITGTGLSMTDLLQFSGGGISITLTSFFDLGGLQGHAITVSVASNAQPGPRNNELTNPRPRSPWF